MRVPWIRAEDIAHAMGVIGGTSPGLSVLRHHLSQHGLHAAEPVCFGQERFGSHSPRSGWTGL